MVDGGADPGCGRGDRRAGAPDRPDRPARGVLRGGVLTSGPAGRDGAPLLREGCVHRRDRAGPAAGSARGPPMAGDAPKRRVRVTAPGEPPVTALAAAADLPALDDPPLAFRARHALIFRSWDATALNLTSPRVTLSFARKDGA